MTQKPDHSTEWRGPSVPEMIKTHTLAENIVKAHNEPCPVFDAASLSMLRRFVNHPADAEQILADHDLSDPEKADYLGQGANNKGDLAGFIVARHRLGVNGLDSKGGTILTDEEVLELKNWFDTGAADERIKSAITAKVGE